jgi:hypothetical protein
MRYIFLLFSGLLILSGTYGRSIDKTLTSLAIRDTISFASPQAATEYIQQLLDIDKTWNSERDSFRLSLSRLIQHANEPFDSVSKRLLNFEYDSLKIKEVEIVKRDTVKLFWLNDSTCIVDEGKLEKEPLIRQTTIIKRIHDTIRIVRKDSVSENTMVMDSLLSKQDTSLISRDTINKRLVHEYQTITTGIVKVDTIEVVEIDTAYLQVQNVKMRKILNGRVTPPVISNTRNQTYWFSADSSRIIITERNRAYIADENSPFYIVTDEKMPDSLKMAVQTLLNYTSQRDSILLYINDVNGKKTPFWLTKGDDEFYRYWIKNNRNDSITIWMGNPSKNELSLLLEQNVNLERLKKEAIEDIPLVNIQPEIKLAKITPLEEIPVYWDYSFSSAFSLNQTYLSNWSKGGENSFSSLLDIDGTAVYKDTKAETEWTNNARIKFGTLITEEYGFRTNTDIFEINSQYNKVIKKKLDFSTIFYMKNQLAKGYKFYSRDSAVMVSKFLNPGTFTIGIGLEYKPFKKTSLNFSPLSYKNTFVLDTAAIDQTLHGIDKDKRARQEMGGQLLVKNSVTLLEDLTISNKIRLFSGYLNKPQNIDIDWEIDLEKKISYYFTILLNLHMIYDDDIRFPVLGENDEPVKLPDGSEYKVPKLQFKQFLGLTFLFKF